MVKNKNYCVDDLPQYSPWPARLLGLEKWEPKLKTPQEVTREFEGEKWGRLLQRAEEAHNPLTVEDIDEWIFPDNPNLLCSVKNRLELLSYREAHKKYITLVERVIKKYLPASALIELGSGYGSVIIPLGRKICFNNLPILAGEYTASGTKLLQILSRNEKKQIRCGRCDFNVPGFIDFEIPRGGIIFTSFSACYLTNMTDEFIESFRSLKPKMVINIEPCYEHFNHDTLMDMMRKRYIELNGYNRNLISILKKFEDDNEIEILEELPAVFGINPILPASIIAWKMI